MTITRSDRKYFFSRDVNPHDKNIFGVLIETFATLNLNISGRYYYRTDEQEQPRSECTDALGLKLCTTTGTRGLRKLLI